MVIIKKYIFILGFSFLSIIVSNGVNADIYKCTNSQGMIVYNDKPCKGSQAEKKIKAIKSPENITSTPTNVAPAGTPSTGAEEVISDEQEIRDREASEAEMEQLEAEEEL
jgi:hypothetical protein